MKAIDKRMAKVIIDCILFIFFSYSNFQEPKTNTDDFFKDINSCCPQEATMQEQEMPFLRGGPGMYKVVKTGPSGHNIRSCPNLRGIPIGMLVLGNKVKAVGEVWILVAS